MRENFIKLLVKMLKDFEVLPSKNISKIIFVEFKTEKFLSHKLQESYGASR